MDNEEAKRFDRGRARVRLLAANLATAGSRHDKGNFGETRAKQWFERQKLTYWAIPQAREEMPRSLSRRGGKRPDFAVEVGGEIIYFDAKFHETAGVTEFGLDDEELAKFTVFREWALEELEHTGPRDVILMVYPQELKGDKFVLIHLDEMLAGVTALVRQKPGRVVSLLDREGAWFDQWPTEKAP